jgi:hypothetical protein
MPETIDVESLKCVLKSAGIDLPAERLQALLPAAERLRAAAQWTCTQDLEWTEPAFVLDAQEHSDSNAG